MLVLSVTDSRNFCFGLLCNATEAYAFLLAYRTSGKVNTFHGGS